jgi:hypothetical protein
LTDLLVNGTRPPEAKKINAGGLLMSLIQNVPGEGKTLAANASSARVAENGATEAELVAAGVANSVTSCRLYAVDSDADAAAVSSSNRFRVYSLLGAEDSYSPPEGEPVYSTGFEDGDPWGQYTYPELTYDVANFVRTPTAIGFTGRASFTPGKMGAYAQWANASLPPIIPAEGSAGKIFRAKMLMSSNSPTAQDTPGYRVLYLNFAFNHVGGFQVYSLTPFGPPNNLPTSGTQKTMRMYWEVPRDLAEYDDGGKLNKVINPALDLRDYYVLFDIVSFEAGETSSIMMEDFEVVRLTRPLSVAPVLQYGAGATPFNDEGGSAWFDLPDIEDYPPQWGSSTAKITTDTIVLNRGWSPKGDGLIQVAPFSTAPILPAWQSDKLVRYSIRIAAADPTAYPPFRSFLLTYPAGSAIQADMLWVDAVDPGSIRAYYPATYSKGTNTSLAGSPKAAGSTIRCYAYMHTATAGAVLDPLIDIAAPAATFPVNGWTAPNSDLTISSYQVEVMNP